MDMIWKSLLVIGSVLIALASSVGIIKWKNPDNNLEQAVERFVESHTGFDIDLSPEDEAKAEFAIRHPQVDWKKTAASEEIAGV